MKTFSNFEEFTILFWDFEKVVYQILKANKFKVENDNHVKLYDLKGSFHNVNVIVEIKLYTTKLPKLDLLEKACNHLLAKNETENSKLLLIVSNFVTPSLKEEVFKKFGVIVWDIVSLFALSYNHAELYYKLENILTQAFRQTVEEFILVEKGAKELILSSFLAANPSKWHKHAVSKGSILCKELKAIVPGVTTAREYEEKCVEILKYLFDNKTDLTLWALQNTTDDDLNRNDLLCRIVSYERSFWEELSNDFHTRYVVFEFKNYTKKIKQTQIFTTEKYLFLTALRSVSIIIARVGADDNALKAAKGALKEAGKLIVVIDNIDLCKMLTLKDNGDEPTIVLRNRIDEILIKLNR